MSGASFPGMRQAAFSIGIYDIGDAYLQKHFLILMFGGRGKEVGGGYAGGGGG